jgi:hypothetical protein
VSVCILHHCPFEPYYLGEDDVLLRICIPAQVLSNEISMMSDIIEAKMLPVNRVS